MTILTAIAAAVELALLPLRINTFIGLCKLKPLASMCAILLQVDPTMLHKAISRLGAVINLIYDLTSHVLHLETTPIGVNHPQTISGVM
jgi:hypothetical protein